MRTGTDAAPIAACRHGRRGFCFDDATDDQRDTFAALYGHAFDWAESGDRAVAEEYAAHFASEHYLDPGYATGHPAEFAEWMTRRRTPAAPPAHPADERDLEG